MLALVGGYFVYSSLFGELRYMIVGGALHSSTLWFAVFFCTLLDPSYVHIFPWKKTEFTMRSSGFPNFSVFIWSIASSFVGAVVVFIIIWTHNFVNGAKNSNFISSNYRVLAMVSCSTLGKKLYSSDDFIVSQVMKSVWQVD